MSKRKPTVYRKIRGIRDDEIRAAVQHLFEQQKTLRLEVREMQAFVHHAFPDQVRWFKDAVEAREAAARVEAAAAAVVDDVAMAHGMGAVEDDTVVEG